MVTASFDIDKVADKIRGNQEMCKFFADVVEFLESKEKGFTDQGYSIREMLDIALIVPVWYGIKRNVYVEHGPSSGQKG